MNAPDGPYRSSASEPGPLGGARFPGPLVLLLSVLSVAAAVLVQWGEWIGDAAVANVLTLVFGFIAFVTLLFWFSFFSGYPRRTRYGVLGVVLATVVVLVAILRIDEVSGDLIPTFRLRWQPRADQRIAAPPVRGGNVDLATTTPLDFPQFLGPHRNGHVDTVALETDWSQQPPEVVWKQPIGAGWSGFAVVNGYAVTMEQRGNEELVTCYEALTGKLRWHHALPVRHATTMGGIGPRATPAIDEGRVYAMGATGVLRCLDGSSGSLLWSQDIPALMQLPDGDTAVAWGRANSPLVVDQFVIVPGGGEPGKAGLNSLIAFDKVTGDEQWRGGQTQISYSSPVFGQLDGVPQIIVVNEPTVSGHDPADGQMLWAFPWPSTSSGDASTSQPVLLPDGVLVSKGYGAGAKRVRVARDENSAWTTETVWENSGVLKTKLTSALVRGDFAFGLSDGILECVDLRTGERQWKGGRYGHGQVLLVGDVLLVSTEEGGLVLVEASSDGHKELATFTALEGKTWNTLCLYGRHLLMRNSEQAGCFELPVAGATPAAPAASPPE